MQNMMYALVSFPLDPAAGQREYVILFAQTIKLNIFPILHEIMYSIRFWHYCINFSNFYHMFFTSFPNVLIPRFFIVGTSIFLEI